MDIWNDPKFEHILAIVGALVPLASALSSFLNHAVRNRQAKGEVVHPALLVAGSALNMASVNLDKAVQLGRMMRGGRRAPDAPVAEATSAPAPESAQEVVVPPGAVRLCNRCLRPL